MSLGADLGNLYRIGYEDLPTLGEHIQGAADNSWTLRSNFGAFSRPAGMGAQSDGSLGAWSAYAQLGNELEDVLIAEARNLKAMGRAVVDCARAYAYADDTARADFDRETRSLDGIPDSVVPGEG